MQLQELDTHRHTVVGLRDTIPGTTRVITIDGARLFFPGAG
jgi:hypothetical protein